MNSDVDSVRRFTERHSPPVVIGPEAARAADLLHQIISQAFNSS
jgi:hypothetical protein